VKTPRHTHTQQTAQKTADEIIKLLESGNFEVECPCCNESLPLKRAGLFYLDNFTDAARERLNDMNEELKTRESDLRLARKKLKAKSQSGAKAVNIGKIVERLAPLLRGFDLERNDCRALFDPIDYVIFEGLTSSGGVKKILFTDIKTGNARLSEGQRQIKSAVEKKRVEFDVYRKS
jgi:predicted Holliday junction resolvase-like endonuclease